MNKSLLKGHNPILKCTLLALSFIMMSCSNETVVGGKSSTPPTSDEFKLTFEIPTYTNQEFFRPTLMEFNEPKDKTLKNIEFWNQGVDCSGALAGFANRASLTNPSVGAQVQLRTNADNLISYRVEFDNGEKGDCEILGGIVHDDIAPPAPLPLQTSYSTSLLTLHIALTNISDDAHEIDVYVDGASSKSITLNATVWKSGLGYISLPENKTTTYSFQVRDRAGNTSPLSSIVTVVQSTSVLNAPALSTPTLELANQIITTSEVTIAGILYSPSTKALIYLGSTFGEPVMEVTKEEFQGGFSFSVIDQAVNHLYITAIDSLGNESAPTVLTLNVNSSPSFTYGLLNTLVFADSPAILNKETELKATLHNGSMESLLGVQVPITSFTASTGSTNIELDNTKGCAVELMPAGGACGLFFKANYSSTGIKNETVNLNINGTAIVLNVEIEVKDVVSATLSPAQLTDLGEFQKLSASGHELVFENGFTSIDLSEMTIDPALASDMNQATHALGEDLYGVKAGKIFVISEDRVTRQITSTRSYADDSLVSVAILGDYLVFAVDNGSGSKDVIIEGVKEHLDQNLDSEIISVGDYAYFRTGTSLRAIDLEGDIQTISGLVIAGDILPRDEDLIVLGESGGNTSLHSISGLTYSDLDVLEGASSFKKLTEILFTYEEAGEHGLFVFDQVVPLGATAPIQSGDINIAESSVSGEVIISAKIQTSLGEKLSVTKMSLVEPTTTTGQLETSVHGDSILGAVFGRESDFLLTNLSLASSAVTGFNSVDYSLVDSSIDTGLGRILGAVQMEDGILAINSVAGISQLNKISLTEDSFEVMSGYFAPSDITLNETLEILQIDPNRALVYYPTLAGMNFKVISLY